REVKTANKAALISFVKEKSGVELDPAMLFDVQVKRLHPYKRQHLNILRVVAAWNRLRRDPSRPMVPRAALFAGKAPPAYAEANLSIKLINSVADVVNRDPVTAGRLRVAFVPDFNVTVGQKIYPAADLSEQISTAGMEASGTGNMKFTMNGAL